jgi:damage-control phosphatase, subfamily I
MKAKVECIPCVFRQALATARCITDDPAVHENILHRVAEVYSTKKVKSTPAHFSQTVYEIIADVTGVRDPYAKEKKQFNELAMAMVPECEKALDESNDPIKTAAHLAVAGNIIDLGIGKDLDIHGTLETALHVPFTHNDLPELKEDLNSAASLLYVGDNAGEIVFDRIFIETLQKLFPALKITFVVKSGPIINDATMEDAEAVGMTKVCDVIETGAACVGAPPDKVNDTFKKAFYDADLVISKGQGNFETLSSITDQTIYFILKAKCDLVAAELGVSFGNSVLKKSPSQ